MNLILSHVFREGNSCADGLARLGLALSNLTVWFDLAVVIRDGFFRNKVGLPNYRFSNF
jgi:hypothetical protein